MAAITTARGYQYTVQVGNGATPTEVFAHPALINTTRGITMTVNAASAEVVDATNQALPATTVRIAQSTDSKIDAAGMLHTSSLKEYMDMVATGKVTNLKFTGPGATITGPYILTSFQITGDRVEMVECTMTFEQAGAVTVTATV
ncbi:hypothetical protein HH800_15610 [Sphingobium yanoikuyae]|jgi:predicted secreted protein|uniref:Phage tail protein n=1 Tax=Sphingobium yanoikuyae TaxID=13690 RepID=A0A6M4G8G1_SPHYA|nr:phage tail tube protein [Sphingobium yanoikuyae]QJR03478.1 hypothetical protein HH800_15610 [Sphingobium yanoikuyae]